MEEGETELTQKLQIGPFPFLAENSPDVPTWATWQDFVSTKNNKNKNNDLIKKVSNKIKEN